MEERKEGRRKWGESKEENLEKRERERESGSSVRKGGEEGRMGGLVRRCVTSAACWIEESRVRLILIPTH